MRLPDILVIGAMKSGSTTLYHDLLGHPSIFLSEKEGNHLTHDISPEAYAKFFSKASSEQMCCDISMRYSMLPDFPGVAERAKRILPTGTKIIYIIREPIARAISHHYHFYSLRDSRRMDASFDRCVTNHPRLINNGRYAMQLRPWLREWGADAIKVIRFEDYIADRKSIFAELCHFLGIAPHTENIDSTEVKNASKGKPVLNRPLMWMQGSTAYQRLLRPCLSLKMRDRIRGWLCPQAPPAPELPGRAVINEMLSVFRKDAKQLCGMLGRDKPLWDFDQVYDAHDARLNREIDQVKAA